jgi:hypothetical protein
MHLQEKKSFFKKNLSFEPQTLMKNRVADTLRGSAAAVAASWKIQYETYFKTG